MGHSKATAREEELQLMLEELIWAMYIWSGDEDWSIHPDAYPAFREALRVAGVPHEPVLDEYSHVDDGYKFTDEGWKDLQNLTLAMRHKQYIDTKANWNDVVVRAGVYEER